jgi:hypothetical protein
MSKPKSKSVCRYCGLPIEKVRLVRDGVIRKIWWWKTDGGFFYCSQGNDSEHQPEVKP